VRQNPAGDPVGGSDHCASHSTTHASGIDGSTGIIEPAMWVVVIRIRQCGWWLFLCRAITHDTCPFRTATLPATSMLKSINHEQHQEPDDHCGRRRYHSRSSQNVALAGANDHQKSRSGSSATGYVSARAGDWAFDVGPGKAPD
jgi:hypothetical protein